MTFDVIYVTYNSEKWIDKCFKSIANCDYDTKKLNIIIVDNDSSDNTVKILKNLKEKLDQRFGSFQIIESKENVGFGRANNIGFLKSKSEMVCFFNIDTEVTEDVFNRLRDEISKNEKEVAMWELRQFPYEHPKLYDILTGYTSWSSGAAFVVRREVFDEVKGFDNQIFLYAEDVDLSWRIISKGYKVKYVPRAIIFHHSYSKTNETKPTQYVYSIINNLNLRIKFGTFLDVSNGCLRLLKILLINPSPFKRAKLKLFRQCIINIFKIPKFLLWRFLYKNKNFKPTFYGLEYEKAKSGAFYINELPKCNPLVSILIRTCGRYEVLREAIISVKNQTYSNIEVVIVEDGPNISEKSLKEEFGDLNIVYRSTSERVGRSKAANTALNICSGDYINFLDDDDLLYPEHVEVLVSQFEKDDVDVIYTNAFEVSTEIKSGFKDKVERDCRIIYNQPFNRVKLFYENYIPIQSAMFKRKIVKAGIQFDEEMDALEDWDFWIQIACEHTFKYVEKTTSLYRVPYDTEVRRKRQQILDSALQKIREKQKQYYFKGSAYDLVKDATELLNQNKTNKLKNQFPILYNIYKLLKKIHSKN